MQLIVSTQTKKMDPYYRLTARYTASTSGTNFQEIQIKAPFMQWITADGYFVAKPFQQWLASSVPLIAQADPKNAVEDVGKGSAQPQTIQAETVGAALDAFATGSNKEAGGKRRKAQ